MSATHVYRMATPRKRQLSRNMGKFLVEFGRRPKIEEPIAGFINGYSAKLIMLNRFDWSTFKLDGYTVLRVKDIKTQRFFSHNSSWAKKAIRKLKIQPQMLPEISVESWSEVVRIGTQYFPLITLHCEIAYPNECYIGHLLEITSKRIVIDNLDTKAKWTGPRTFELNQITRIDYGSGYETALAAVAASRPR
jgi:hypothetical protein